MRDSLKLILHFVLYVLLQGLILNNIHLYGLACPYLYVLFVLTLPTAMSSAITMPIAFVLGVCIDAFSNSYGVHAAATVLVAFLRPYILPLIATRENMEKIAPSYATFGKSFFAYAAILVVIHHFALFMLEAFSFAHIGVVLVRTVCSALATMVLIFCWQILTPKSR
ncbi:MAG: rod shape-determining protein MreD [Paludibacteraceae bacterium]